MLPTFGFVAWMAGPIEMLLLLGVVGVVVVVVVTVVLLAVRRQGSPGASPNLVPCPDCGRLVSRAANACPGCGRPMTPTPGA
ncbi:MAG: hypothetical protein HYS13_00285 [Planctomycetia bacterium]|nr:hypothetical protein [Planctomycetia bacterium]